MFYISIHIETDNNVDSVKILFTGSSVLFLNRIRTREREKKRKENTSNSFVSIDSSFCRRFESKQNQRHISFAMQSDIVQIKMHKLLCKKVKEYMTNAWKKTNDEGSWRPKNLFLRWTNERKKKFYFCRILIFVSFFFLLLYSIQNIVSN